MNDSGPSVSSNAYGIDYLSAMLTGHRLALSIQDEWTSCVKAQVNPLIEIRDRIGATPFDEDTLFDDLMANLSEFFKDRVVTLQDEMFSHDFVQQSHTQTVTIVANAIPNDVAANYDFDVLQHSLREIVGNFASRARKLPRWEAKVFKKRLQKSESKKQGLLGMWNVDHSEENRKVVQSARDQVGLLIDDIRELARATGDRLVDAALSPRQAPSDLQPSKS